MTLPTDTGIDQPLAHRKPRDEELDVFGLTHPGKIRQSNQDHFLFSTLHKTLRVRTTSLANPEILEAPSERLASLFMVADGVGGSEDGEAASRTTVEMTQAIFAPCAAKARRRVRPRRRDQAGRRAPS